jgi:hypothetical protein
MKNLTYLIPTRFAITLGTAVGAATQNLAVGIAIVILLSISSKLKLGKNPCL